MRSDAIIGTMIATAISCLCKTSIEADKIVAKPAVDPTDKSSPLTVNDIVTPSAIKVTMEIERRISLMFSPVKS